MEQHVQELIGAKGSGTLDEEGQADLSESWWGLWRGGGGADSQGQIPDGVKLKALFYKHKKATGGFVNRFIFTKFGFCVRGGLREEVTQGSNRDFCKGWMREKLAALIQPFQLPSVNTRLMCLHLVVWQEWGSGNSLPWGKAISR